ncbi:putative sulfate permease C3H7,02 OS=Schizosaccharomyces pombe (strain 972 / ATCC 24843) GN=SPBC3H7.02 PE=3 SV=1 [Rhizoctonia solani AG-1 IB]|uniref:Putative sulfate permease C3H7,02 n=1 Tax=Thanatephorus cucumeris (strain AG1-IB / isolate 7/3/14) TaxID=1108050 RepID=A0A0B7FP29_THACB|nr:putative sulfate permease C3H7,02 OS=Schizosaccharomyces pombe (strain 972 / ATCC 24843) GN=SPBC3H7.02 PE=3 SV=1 [Rhizoctonia solani AG-1 IB]
MADRLRNYGKKVFGYPEREVTSTISTRDYFRQFRSTDAKQGVLNYLKSLFPVFQWITRYNLGWATGDIIAGLTVGLVLVPQSMSYAKIATLSPEYGLYASFVGVFVYCFFATSKDVSIGPVAVMSLQVANVIKHVQNSHPGVYTGPEIAVALAFICGIIVLGIGLLRIGRLVEFIPAPAVSGFMTGSAISIVAGQVPGLFGIAGRFDTRAATYRVIINTLKNLHYATLDAAFGVAGLVALYTIKYAFLYLAKRFPRRERLFFFLSIARNAFVIVILTVAAYLYAHPRKDAKGNYPISVLKTVPRGFKHVGQPRIDAGIISALGSQIPVSTIILLLEHIAISKSFGRLNGYKINPNQELIAIGVTNTIGTLFAAYPATGSFSRSALKSKSGVRTPAAGWITGITVIVALYGLTDAFYWIPNAGLSAIIIHAVADLVASPAQAFMFWRVAPLEYIIWLAAVLVTIFSSIENGIYTSIVASIALLLIRIAIPGGQFLGRVTVSGGENKQSRDVYVPLAINGGVMNPHIKVETPTNGVIIYRLEESITFPNSSSVNSALVEYAKEHTKRGKDMTSVPLSERPWNDPGPRRGAQVKDDASKPILRAVVLDFSAVAHIDTTGVQNLMDTRKELERWADGPVEFRFASILSPWIRRALVAGGFGTGEEGRHIPHEVAPIVPPPQGEYTGPNHEYAITTINPISSGGKGKEQDLEEKSAAGSSTSSVSAFEAPIVSRSTPYFHLDLNSAVRAAGSFA